MGMLGHNNPEPFHSITPISAHSLLAFFIKLTCFSGLVNQLTICSNVIFAMTHVEPKWF
jgi:hypothetical protein